MNALTSPHQYVRSGGDHIPTRRLQQSPSCRPSLAARKSLPSLAVQMSHREHSSSLAVGLALLSALSVRSLRYRSIKMLASKHSIGKRPSFNGVDISLFGAVGSISKQFAPIAVDSGSIFVDNSSAFRMDKKVPLVIPEVNPEAMALINLGSGKDALIANPNCSTIICLMAAAHLHRHAKVLPMVVSTYQAASGAGAAAAAMEELEQQTREVLEGEQPTCNIFKQQERSRS